MHCVGPAGADAQSMIVETTGTSNDLSERPSLIDFINTLSQFPVATLFILAGIGFLLLSIAGSLAGKITVEPAKQKIAGAIGVALIALGVMYPFLAPDTPRPAQPGPSPAASAIAVAPAQPPARVEPPTPVAVQPTPPNPTPGIAGGGPGPGVNCTGTQTEAAICGSAALSALDRELFAIYWALYNKSNDAQQKQLKNEEIVWVAQRDRCQRNESCIETTYRSRIEQLKSEQ
jgi:hypothetical protein